jgi:recombination protein RecA
LPAKPASGAKRKAGPSADALVALVRKALPKDEQSAVSKLSEGGLASVVEWIPSGFPDLDRILGGGWAVGRASEVSGPPGQGKSALTHRAIKSAQVLGGTPMVLDFEHSLEEGTMIQLDIDPERLIYVPASSLESGWSAVWALLGALRKKPPEVPQLIVWDSIPAAPPRSALEGTEVTSIASESANINSRNCARMFHEIASVRAHMMWVNQVRTKMGARSFGGQETRTPGGYMLEHAASIRVSCQIVKRLRPKTTRGTPPSGYVIKTITNKCRLAPPHRSTEWVLDFTVGPSPDLTMRHLLTEAGILKGPSNKVTAPWRDEPFRRGEWLRLLRWDRGFRSEANRAMRALVAEGGVWEYLEKNRAADDEEGDED